MLLFVNFYFFPSLCPFNWMCSGLWGVLFQGNLQWDFFFKQKVEGSCWLCPFLPACTHSCTWSILWRRVWCPTQLCTGVHLNLFVDFSLETDHSAGGNFIPTALQLKKNFLRLLHFMGGNILEHPLSLAWSPFRSHVGCVASEMHTGFCVMGCLASFPSWSQSKPKGLVQINCWFCSCLHVPWLGVFLV